MKILLAAALASMMLAAGTVRATLTIGVADNGTTIAGCSVTGASPQSASCSNANFTSIGITTQGFPTVPSPDLGTISISATAGALSANHMLDIVVTQSGLNNFAGGLSSTTFTYNSLIGVAGPVTYTSTFNGTVVATDTLGPSLNPQTGGPFFVNLPAVVGAFTDGQEILASFGPSLQTQQLEADAQFQVISAIREPGSLAVFGTALLLGTVFLRRRSR